jgi:hypothetical protein
MKGCAQRNGQVASTMLTVYSTIQENKWYKKAYYGTNNNKMVYAVAMECYGATMT